MAKPVPLTLSLIGKSLSTITYSITFNHFYISSPYLPPQPKQKYINPKHRRSGSWSHLLLFSSVSTGMVHHAKVMPWMPRFVVPMSWHLVAKTPVALGRRNAVVMVAQGLEVDVAILADPRMPTRCQISTCGDCGYQKMNVFLGLETCYCK